MDEKDEIMKLIRTAFSIKSTKRDLHKKWLIDGRIEQVIIFCSISVTLSILRLLIFLKVILE